MRAKRMSLSTMMSTTVLCAGQGYSMPLQTYYAIRVGSEHACNYSVYIAYTTLFVLEAR
jgi:hypothetical protein